MTDYCRKFYDDLGNTALPSARRIVPILLELLAPNSVIDIGCGDGSWLSVFRDCGVEDVLGLDGDWVDDGQLKIPAPCFHRIALDRPFHIDRHFDVALCLEVAEHLPETGAREFISELTALAPVVIFSAAIPHQGGHHHVNEQWPDYWAGHFESHGYHAIDTIRPLMWNDPDVTWWYKQNLLLFATNDAIEGNDKLKQAWRAMPQGSCPWFIRKNSFMWRSWKILASAPGSRWGPGPSNIVSAGVFNACAAKTTEANDGKLAGLRP